MKDVKDTNVTRTDKVGSQQWSAVSSFSVLVLPWPGCQRFFLRGFPRLHCVVKKCNASPRANTHKLPNDRLVHYIKFRTLAAFIICIYRLSFFISRLSSQWQGKQITREFSFINWVDNVSWQCKLATVKRFGSWRRANARNVSFRISLRWLTYIVNSVDKTKLSCNTPTDAAPQFL